MFKEYSEFDVAEALYLWLSHHHDGQCSAKYKALCQLTAPGMFKPAPSLSEETLESEALDIYDMLTNENYEQALDYVLSYESEAE